ncbi:MAG: FecR domain-containing protein [Bdellovibrionaceae bacterium]|nr:FecR domain-containing protein [Pseudobdellovibrionaceae bacterium]MDW8190954.1 FecR domain-containing protein [Pseudobdellovibrionaceae bacterium]
MNWRWRLGIAIALSVFVFSINQIWYSQKTKIMVSSSGLKVAELVDSQSTVFRRPAGRIVWMNSQVGDVFHEGDSIRTDTTSSAKIRMVGGSEIALEPETMVTFNFVHNKIKLKLWEGSIEKISSSTDAKEIVVQTAQNNEISLNKTGQNKITVSQDEGNYNNNFQVLEPKNKSSVYVSEQNQWFFPVLLSTPQSTIPSDLQVFWGYSRSRLRKTPFWVKDPKGWLLLSLPEGQLYLQFYSKQSMLKSPVYSFKVIHLKKPEIFQPKPGISQKVMGSGIPLVVGYSPFVKNLFYELKKNGKVVHQQIINGNQPDNFIPVVPNEVYSLKVYAKYPNNQIIPSDEVIFETVPPFVTEKPMMKFYWNNFQEELMVPKLPYRLPLSWTVENREEDIDRFDLLATEPNGKSKTLSFAKNNRSIFFDVLNYGEYQFKLRVVAKNELDLAPPIEGRIKLDMLPLLGPVNVKGLKNDRLSADGLGNIIILWGDLPNIKGYVLELKKDSETKRFEASKGQISLKGLLPGTYQARVLPLDIWGRNGVATQWFFIDVPEMSSIRAPTSRGVKVK